MPRLRATVQEVRLGALYRVGARWHLGRDRLVQIMVKRTNMKQFEAEQLVAHWLTTEPYRKPLP